MQKGAAFMRDETPFQLLQCAMRDLRVLGHMLDEEDFPEAIFGFHAQQAAEKLLKVWLICATDNYPMFHDLSMLLKLLERAEVDTAPYTHFESLTDYAVRFRYESTLDSEPLERRQIITDIQGLLGLVQARFAEAESQGRFD
jgi:HEPN domain-containing protein